MIDWAPGLCFQWLRSLWWELRLPDTTMLFAHCYKWPGDGLSTNTVIWSAPITPWSWGLEVSWGACVSPLRLICILSPLLNVLFNSVGKEGMRSSQRPWQQKHTSAFSLPVALCLCLSPLHCTRISWSESFQVNDVYIFLDILSILCLMT